jgi:chemotaxis protein MotA
MSLPTLLGFLFGVLLLAGAVVMSSDNPLGFLSFPSLMIVLGGTIASAFISFESRYVLKAFGQLWGLVFAPKEGRGQLNVTVERIVEWGTVLKKSGLPGLEDAIGNDAHDPFALYGLDLLLRGYPPDEVREMLENTIDSNMERDMAPVNALKTMGAAAPAFGMVGTLIGLIVMLEGIGEDISQLGIGLAVALVTTLYGVLFSRLVFLPGAAKAQQRMEIRRFQQTLLAEGFTLLAEERSPQQIADRMNGFLDPAIRYERKRKGAGSAS